MTTMIMVSGALGLAPAAALEGSWSRVGLLKASQWGAIAFLVIACSIFGYFVYNYALAHLPAYRVATWLYFEPVVAAVLGLALLQEQISAYTLVGGALIAGSVYLVERK